MYVRRHRLRELHAVVGDHSSEILTLRRDRLVELLLRRRQRVVLHDDVRRDAAAAIDRAARVGLERRTRLLGRVGLVRVRRRFDELAVHELARTLNRAPARREPFARRELERVAAVERIHALHQTLAVARLSDDERAIVILQRAGDDLGRRGGALVGHHDERNGRRGRRGLCDVDLLADLHARARRESAVPASGT